MRRWTALAPMLLVAGCLARVEQTIIKVRDPATAVTKSATVLEREGFNVPTLEPGLARTSWRFTERAEGDGYLYYRYVVEQQPAGEGENITLRIEVISCQYAPTEGEDWGRSGCTKMPPRVPLWAESDYRRIEKVLRGVHRARTATRSP